MSAFEFAHKKGVVHRDVKPSNIFIETQKGNNVKILDFGIAKLLDNDAELTNTGAQMGTAIYMSPEQVKDSKNINHLTDIYSLGVVLYYMLKGEAPYDRTTLSDFDIKLKIVQDEFPELTAFPELNKIIKKATTKNPADRYQTCHEFKKALEVNFDKVPNFVKVETINEDETLIDNEQKNFDKVPNFVKVETIIEDETLIDNEQKNFDKVPNFVKVEPNEDVTLIDDPETELWDKIKNKTDIQLFKNYLQKYPNGKYKQQASKKIGQLIVGKKTVGVASKSKNFVKVPNFAKLEKPKKKKNKNVIYSLLWLLASFILPTIGMYYYIVGSIISSLIAILFIYKKRKTIKPLELSIFWLGLSFFIIHYSAIFFNINNLEWFGSYDVHVGLTFGSIVSLLVGVGIILTYVINKKKNVKS